MLINTGHIQYLLLLVFLQLQLVHPNECFEICLWIEQDVHNEDIMRGGEIKFKERNETKQVISCQLHSDFLYQSPMNLVSRAEWTWGCVCRISQLLSMQCFIFILFWFLCEVAIFCSIGQVNKLTQEITQQHPRSQFLMLQTAIYFTNNSCFPSSNLLH